MPVRARLRDGAPLTCISSCRSSESDWLPVPQRSETTELLIVLSEAARQSLRAGLIEDSDVVTQMLVDIDVEEAKAEQESDHRQLSVRTDSLPHVAVCG